MELLLCLPRERSGPACNEEVPVTSLRRCTCNVVQLVVQDYLPLRSKRPGKLLVITSL